MREFIVSESLLIEAPAERVYGILADYIVGHPQILPRPPFESLEVESEVRPPCVHGGRSGQ